MILTKFSILSVDNILVFELTIYYHWHGFAAILMIDTIPSLILQII